MPKAPPGSMKSGCGGRACAHKLLVLLCVVLACLATPAAAFAASVIVVAIGGSNTAGEGVGRDRAYPAQLQEMLRARGYDVRVLNSGQEGDTSAGMLERLNFAVPRGTDIVIAEHGGLNAPPDISRRDHLDNVAMMELRLGLRDISVLHIDQILAGIADANIQPDAAHLTEAGHRIVARRLTPRIIEEIDKLKAEPPQIR